MADTLDPAGYYPLQVGNVWEYDYHHLFIYDPDPFRFEVVEEVPWQGRTAFKVKRTVYTSTGTWQNPAVVLAGTGYSFVALKGDTLFTGDGLEMMQESSIQLRHAFNTCYVLSSSPPGTEYDMFVNGDYSGTWTVWEDGELRTVPVAARKTFVYFQGVAAEDYAHGIGLVGSMSEGGSGYGLLFARIGDAIYGTPIESQYAVQLPAGEEPSPASELNLHAYPNPTSGAGHGRFALPHPGFFHLGLHDVTGRLVQTVSDGYLPAGTHAFEWDVSTLSSGVYVLVLSTENHAPVARKVVVM